MANFKVSSLTPWSLYSISSTYRQTHDMYLRWCVPAAIIYHWYQQAGTPVEVGHYVTPPPPSRVSSTLTKLKWSLGKQRLHFRHPRPSACIWKVLVPKQGGLTKETTRRLEHQSPPTMGSFQLTGHFPILLVLPRTRVEVSLVLPLLPISTAPLAPTAYLRYPWLGYCCRKFLLIPTRLMFN